MTDFNFHIRFIPKINFIHTADDDPPYDLSIVKYMNSLVEINFRWGVIHWKYVCTLDWID